MNKDLEYINKLRKQLLDKKESAPIPKKEPIEIVFEPSDKKVVRIILCSVGKEYTWNTLNRVDILCNNGF